MRCAFTCLCKRTLTSRTPISHNQLGEEAASFFLHTSAGNRATRNEVRQCACTQARAQAASTRKGVCKVAHAKQRRATTIEVRGRHVGTGAQLLLLRLYSWRDRILVLIHLHGKGNPVNVATRVPAIGAETHHDRATWMELGRMKEWRRRGTTRERARERESERERER